MYTLFILSRLEPLIIIIVSTNQPRNHQYPKSCNYRIQTVILDHVRPVLPHHARLDESGPWVICPSHAVQHFACTFYPVAGNLFRFKVISFFHPLSVLLSGWPIAAMASPLLELFSMVSILGWSSVKGSSSESLSVSQTNINTNTRGGIRSNVLGWIR